MRPAANPLGVTSVMEIRLHSDTWRKISETAQAKKVSRSWIVRCCLRLLLEKWEGERGKHRKNPPLPPRKKEEIHRHLLCLYGKDAEYLRLHCLERGCTFSALVRLSIAEFLTEVEEFSERELTEKGIKLMKEFSADSPVMEFHNSHFKFNPFDPEEIRPFRPWRGKLYLNLSRTRR